MSNNSSTVDLSCFTVYDNDGFVAVVAVRVALSIFSILCCLGMLLIIALFKKYLFFAQRLIAYLAIATLAYSVVSAINVEGYKAYRNDAIRGYCVFTGLLEQIVSWWVLLAISCIVFDLFVKIMLKRETERFEWVYIIVTLVTPLVTAWIPFINLAYGSSGAWCWIRGNNYDDCSLFTFGVVLRFVLYYGPFYLLMCGLLIALIIVFIQLRKQRRSWTGNFDPTVLTLKKKMSQEVFPLISYPIIFLVINIIPLILRIVNAVKSNEPIIALWFLSTIVFSLQGAVVMLAFALDPETRRNLAPMQLLGAIKRLVTREGKIDEYEMGDDSGGEPEVVNSTSISFPSYPDEDQ